MAENKKEEKHLKLSPLDTVKFIKANELEAITNPMFFSRANMPAPDGLLSNEIFGITKEDRTSIFAYIDLAGETFMHPLGYKIWTRLDSNVKLCAWEMGTFILNKKEGKLVPDPNGKTGIKYLQEVIKIIDFKKTNSDKREIRIDFLEKYREKLFMKEFIVIPAGYRDVNTDSDSRIGVGEINQIYNAIIRDCNALREADEYGLTLNGTLRGRIQDNIVAVYDWLIFGRFKGQESQASGLSRKLGLIRRAGMKKSFDWGARLVICTQNLRKENVSDIDVDLDSIGLPIAALCANLFPFMLHWLRTYFEMNFADTVFIPVIINGKVIERRIKDWQAVYSDENIKKQLDRFMHGMTNRFIPIEVPVDLDGIPNAKNVHPYLTFKGYMVDDEEAANKVINYIRENNKDPESSNIVYRPLTWCDLIYRAAMDICKDKMVLITRFPVDSYWNQFPAKIKVISTIETEPMVVNGHYYKKYPKINMEDIGKNSSNKFIDVALPNNVRLGSIGGDYDGDTISSKVTYSIEANNELRKLVDSKRHYISLGAENEMTTTKEGIQALYNLTLVLPDDLPKLTNPVFEKPPKYCKNWDNSGGKSIK